MKVMLVQPNSESVVKTVLETTGMPLGLGYLAAVLREEGHELRIIDALTLNFGLNALKRELKKYKPEVVGITATTPAIYDAYEVAKVSKEQNPEIKTVIGGPHATFTAKETLEECPALDAVVRNEGELTAKELVRAWEKEKGDHLKRIPGLTFRQCDEIKETVNRPFIKNLDEIPFPAYDLLPMNRYRFGDKRYGMVMTSRGCPFNCIFCASSLICGKKWRARSPQNVVEELKVLNSEYGNTEIEFMDDTFTLNKKRAEEICDLLIKEGADMDLSWSCSAHANTINKSLAEKIKKAGCHDVYIGAESGSQGILDLIGKGTSLEKIKNAIEAVKSANLNVLASFILGIPGETVKTIKSTIKFAKKLNPTYAQFTLCTPFPGTKLFDIAKEKGLLITKDWRKYTTVDPVMNIPGMSTERLRKLFDWAYISFYLRPRFVFTELTKKRSFLLKKALLGALEYYTRKK